jgi:hypothetical protein
MKGGASRMRRLVKEQKRLLKLRLFGQQNVVDDVNDSVRLLDIG